MINKTPHRRIANSKMTKSLHDIFYSVELGYSGLSKFIKTAEEFGHKKDAAREFWRLQSINELNKAPAPSNIPYNTNQRGVIIADLVDISLLRGYNDQYKWILTFVDVRSRHAWAFPMLRKKPENVMEHLPKVTPHMTSFITDKGSEFMGPVTTFLAKLKIPHDLSKNTGRTQLVELFNKILVTKLFKIMKSRGDFRWIDMLPSVVAGCNINKGLADRWQNTRELIDSLMIGDFVRIQNVQGKFNKGARTNRWSDEVYQILTRDRARYVLVDRDNKILDMTYLPRQLLAAKETESNENFVKATKQHKKVKKAATFTRKQRKSGLDADEDGVIAIPESMQPRHSTRKSTSKYARRPIE